MSNKQNDIILEMRSHEQMRKEIEEIKKEEGNPWPPMRKQVEAWEESSVKNLVLKNLKN